MSTLNSTVVMPQAAQAQSTPQERCVSIDVRIAVRASRKGARLGTRLVHAPSVAIEELVLDGGNESDFHSDLIDAIHVVIGKHGPQGPILGSSPAT